MRLVAAETLARDYGFKSARALHEYVCRVNARKLNRIVSIRGKVDADRLKHVLKVNPPEHHQAPQYVIRDGWNESAFTNWR